MSETCNGLDDDCDGDTEEGVSSLLCCGTGACHHCFESCEYGTIHSCTPLPTEDETCNGLDDDCDGITDNGTTLCNDNNVCTTTACEQGTCKTISTLSCDDSDACTLDTCNPLSGCEHAPALTCDSPPDPFCSEGAFLITYSPLGMCQDGTCTYETATQIACEFGCEEGACTEGNI